MNEERVQNGMTANYKGDVTEAAVSFAFTLHGYIVSQPKGANQRYDLLVDKYGIKSSVQCKTAVLRDDGTLDFNCCSGTYAGSDGSSNYIKDVDYFGIYNIEDGKVYIFPVGKNVRSQVLRLDSCTKRKTKKSKFAKDYYWPFKFNGPPMELPKREEEEKDEIDSSMKI